MAPCLAAGKYLVITHLKSLLKLSRGEGGKSKKKIHANYEQKRKRRSSYHADMGSSVRERAASRHGTEGCREPAANLCFSQHFHTLRGKKTTQQQKRFAGVTLKQCIPCERDPACSQ